MAATFTVTKTADTNDGVCDADCSLREAVAAANAISSDDSIDFSSVVFSVPRTITLGGSHLQVESNGSLIIGGPNFLTVSGNNLSRVFLVNDSATLTISNIQITRGNAPFGAGIFSKNFTALTLNNVVIINNRASTSGGGIYKELGGLLSITNSTILDNSAPVYGGGIMAESDTLLNNVAVSQNSGAEMGGGITCYLNCKVIANNLTLNNNNASNTGGGIFITSPATFDLANSTIRNNSAPVGGSIRNHGKLTISQSAIYDSTSTGANGGGAGIANTGTASLVNTTIAGNTAFGGNGGGISNFSGGVLDARNLTIARNAAVNGGGVSVSDGIFTSGNSIYGDNTASSGPSPDYAGTLNSLGFNLIENTNGTAITGDEEGNILQQDAQLLPLENNGGTGGIVIRAGDAFIEKSVITNNRSLGQNGTSNSPRGGGIYFSGQMLTINNSVISNNSAIPYDVGIATAGGGIHIGSNARITNTLISNNRADSGGGVWADFFAAIELTNVTLSGNQANLDGGAIFRLGQGSGSFISLKASTISNNLAVRNGGGISIWNSGETRLQNTIVANNSANAGPDIWGPVLSRGFNLIENTTEAIITGDTTGNILGQDPILDPRLLLNGGMTPNHALRVGSPAIDAGGTANPAITTDQRGLPRPYDFPSLPNASGGNGSDIGAFERQAVDVSGLEFAAVSGKVLTPDGRGLRNARVSITDSQGVTITATTSSFGVYSFNSIRTGENYTVGVASKRYRFAARILTINDNLSDLDFVGLE